MALPERPYDFLFGSLRILLADDNEQQRDLYESFLGDCPVFKVVAAATKAEALSHLSARPRTHTCVLDWLFREAEDAAEVLAAHGGTTVIVVFTGCRSAECGASARQLGAWCVLDKSEPNVGLDRLYGEVSRAAVAGLLVPSRPPNPDAGISRAVRQLVDGRPESVAHWAHLYGASESGLRDVWAGGSPVEPRDAVFLSRLYQAAFDCHALTPDLSRRVAAESTSDRYRDLREQYFVNQHRFRGATGLGTFACAGGGGGGGRSQACNAAPGRGEPEPSPAVDVR